MLEAQIRGLMNSQQKITNTVIVPAYNEEAGIDVVLGKLCKIVDRSTEVIVVDDGSTDRTAEVARKFPCKIICHPANQGKTHAVKTGLEAAVGENIVLIDADDTYPTEVIPEIFQALADHDMVVGSRVRGRENIPLLNRFGNRIFSFMIRHLYGYMPCDPLTGLYGIRKSVLVNMNLDSTGFGIETEMAIKAGRMKLNVLDIPIDYAPRIGEAKLHGFSGGFQILKTILEALALYSPSFFFVLPGIVLLALGISLVSILAFGPVEFGSIILRSNTQLVAAMAAFAGFQTIVFGIGLDCYAAAHRFAAPGIVTRTYLRRNVSRNLGWIGLLAALAGTGILAWVGLVWASSGFGLFSRTTELVVGGLLAVLGMQLAFTSSFLSVFVSEARNRITGPVS